MPSEKSTRVSIFGLSDYPLRPNFLVSPKLTLWDGRLIWISSQDWLTEMNDWSFDWKDSLSIQSVCHWFEFLTYNLLHIYSREEEDQAILCSQDCKWSQAKRFAPRSHTEASLSCQIFSFEINYGFLGAIILVTSNYFKFQCFLNDGKWASYLIMNSPLL